ncbi:MAG: CpaE family protein [Kineosporiaceae bacterium]
MTGVVVAAADQGLARQIQSQLAEIGDVEVLAVVATSREASDAVLEHEVDVALVHEALGPEPVLSLIRDLGVRRPATAMLLIATEPDTETVTAAMEAGARGLVTLPLTFGQIEGRLRSSAAWSQQIRRTMVGGADPDDDLARGRTVGIAGAKGGVGATTISCHLALDVARSVPWARVCLVDLDLEKGDVPGIIDVRHRVGVSDLAKVATDLSPGTVADAVTRHESGVDLLLAPYDVHDVEWVTPVALRQVLAVLRREYDLVLVDLGSHATPAQVTAIELADEVVLVVTPDVVAVRGMRRSITAWETLGVCKEPDVRVLVNRVSKQVTMSPDTIRQLTRASVLPHHLPAGYRRLEPAVDARNPLALHHQAWWATLRRIGRELGLVTHDAKGRPLSGTRSTGTRAVGPSRAPSAPSGSAPGEPAPGEPRPSGSAPEVNARPSPGRPAGHRGEQRAADESAAAPVGAATAAGAAAGAGRVAGAGSRWRQARSAADDTGLVSLEALVVFPFFVVLTFVVWHMAALGIAVPLQANAAAAATRAAAIGLDPQQAAQDALPGSFADGVRVAGGGGNLTVSLSIDGFSTFPGLPRTITTTRTVVAEP